MQSFIAPGKELNEGPGWKFTNPFAVHSPPVPVPFASRDTQACPNGHPGFRGLQDDMSCICIYIKTESADLG